MGFLRGFIEFERIEQPHVPVEERVKSFCEIYGTLTDEQAKFRLVVAWTAVFHSVCMSAHYTMIHLTLTSLYLKSR